MARILISFSIIAGGAAWAATRTWTDKTGKHTTEAELVKATSDSVVLKLSDGKTKTVPLDKLSDADRKFIADHLAATADDTKKSSKTDTGKPAAKGPEAAAVRKVAKKFFDNLGKEDEEDKTALEDTLTATAKQQFTAGGSAVSSLPKPDTSRSVKLGKATIDGEEATLAFKIRIGGKDQDAKMYMRREAADWKIRAVSATPPEGEEQTIDFEAAGTGSFAGESSGEVRGEAPGAPMADPALAIPDDDPQAMLAFIGKLSSDPRLTQDATFLKQALPLMLAASDKVLNHEDANKTQLTTAARYKMGTLQAMVFSRDSAVNEQIEAFEKQIDKLQLEELKRPVKSLSLLADVNTARTPAAVSAAVKKVNLFLSEGEIEQSEAMLANSAAGVVEDSGMKPGEIAQALESLSAPLIASKDEQVAAIGNRLAGKARRFGLVGNPMELRGLTWDGKPLDMAQFEGKVVLVDFWATWCGPCIAEMPNIRKNYDKYHEQGFEVIAISIDDDQKALRDYVEKEKVPWTVVADRHEDASRSDSMSDYYGVNSIPSTILIGRDGKVVSLSARGAQLDKQLEKLIGSGG